MDYQKDKKAKNKPPKLERRDDRGVQSFFRTLYKNHYTLLVSVDRKARILISTISLLLSLVFTLVMINADDLTGDKVRLVTIGIFAMLCLLSLVFAVSAINPHMKHGSQKLENIKKKEGSFLYFGNFLSQPLNNYLEEMNTLLNNGRLMYDSILTDIYFLGQVIERKNRYLRISLYVFFVAIAFISLAPILRRLLHY